MILFCLHRLSLSQLTCHPLAVNHLLILFFLSHPSYLHHCYTSPPLGTSDHFCINIGISPRQGSTNSVKTSPRTIWRYNHADFELANKLLSAFKWDEILCGNIDQIWTKWENQFMAVMEQCIPIATLTSKKNLPWLNRNIIKAIRERNRAFKRAKKSRKSEHMQKYKKQRNMITNMLRSAKLNFFKNLDPSSPKSFWKVAKFLTKQSSTIPILQDDYGDTIQDDTEKASLLNDFFSKCFNRALPPLGRTDYEEIDLSITGECPADILCSEEEVEQMLLSLDTTKSSGSDGISAIMLKETAFSITPGITKLFNISIRTGTIPEAWKISSIVPIPKGSKHNSVSTTDQSRCYPFSASFLKGIYTSLSLTTSTSTIQLPLSSGAFNQVNQQY